MTVSVPPTVLPIAWDGFARLSRAGEGLIALFRNASAAPEAAFRLPLMDEARYHLRSVYDERDYGTFSAADFRAGVAMPFVADVDVIEVRRLQS